MRTHMGAPALGRRRRGGGNVVRFALAIVAKTVFFSSETSGQSLLAVVFVRSGISKMRMGRANEMTACLLGALQSISFNDRAISRGRSPF